MKEKDGTVRSLEKAILLLNILSQKTEDTDLANLAKTANLPKSTALRLLVTLKKHNFVQQNKNTRRFNLGWSLISLGKSAENSFNLIRLCHPYLVDLVNFTGESATLSIFQEDHLVYIDQVISNNLIKGIPIIGANLLLHSSSSGKAFLSTFDTEKLDDIINNLEFTKKTDHTITDPAILRQQLTEVQKQGFATDDEETEIGGRCVAAPIFDVEGKCIASISIIGPTSRVTRNDLLRLGKIISDTAIKASAAIGYTGSLKK